jgi:hypothetical protein
MWGILSYPEGGGPEIPGEKNPGYIKYILKPGKKIRGRIKYIKKLGNCIGFTD